MTTRTTRPPRASGFTIIELMVVVAIIGLLAGIALPYYQRTLRQAHETALRHDLRVLRELIQQYKVDKRKFPESLQSLVDDGYLRVVPKDPITNSESSWIEVKEEPEDPDDPNADTGVRDVQSGAAGVDLHGTPFSEY